MQLLIQDHDCLTSQSKEKSIHYLTLSLPDSSNEKLDYEPGDWLTIQPQNRDALVADILQALSLSGNEIIELRRIGEVSCFEALKHHLEITQLNPAILNKLQRQLELGQWESRQAMMDFAKGKDMLDLLEFFPLLKTMGVEALSFFSPLAPRYYSIASANTDGRSVSILYRKVHYEHEQRARYGVASNFICDQEKNGVLEAEIKHNPTFKMPDDSCTPMIMIAAGTGLAPFIGFMQQREINHNAGQAMGKAMMFFGETNRQNHCFFCDEFKRWQSMGLVDSHYAFSRDQAEKFYVQHAMEKQADSIWSLLKEGAHIYICGSQDRLAVDVKNSCLQIFQQQGGMSAEEAEQHWNELRKQKRLQQDVY